MISGLSEEITKAAESKPNMTEADIAAEAVKVFSEAGISITYMYSFLLRGKGVLIFRTDDKERAVAVIKDNNLKSIDEAALAQLV